MALANFFEKNMLATHQILGGVDAMALASVLHREVVALAVDAAGCDSLEGRRTARLAVDLFARFYPRLALIPLGDAGPLAGFIAELEARARAINPEIEFQGSDFTRALVVGVSRLPADTETVVYVGSNGWRLRLSLTGPVGSGATGNPFGAGAAACLGVANIFRGVMKSYLPTAQLDRELDISIVDWGSPFGGSPPPNLDSVEIDLAETLIGGVGAIGNAAIWGLAAVPRLRGIVRLVDPQAIELSNLQRYVLTDQGSVNVAKVDLAASELDRRHSHLDVTRHRRRWGSLLSERASWSMPRVATAFDSVADRVAAQGSLPRSLLNAWTQLGNLGVSRHTSFGETPCLACLYAPHVGGKSEAERVANDLGFEGAPMEIRALLYTREPVSDDFVRRVAANLNRTAPSDLELLLRQAGRPLREFYTETVCGGVMLQLGVTPSERPAEVPMAFQSALAGIMLAAEIVLDAARVESREDYQGPTRTALDLLRPLPPHPHLRIARRNGCICTDADYLHAYRHKYAIARDSHMVATAASGL